MLESYLAWFNYFLPCWHMILMTTTSQRHIAHFLFFVTTTPAGISFLAPKSRSILEQLLDFSGFFEVEAGMWTKPTHMLPLLVVASPISRWILDEAQLPNYGAHVAITQHFFFFPFFLLLFSGSHQHDAQLFRVLVRAVYMSDKGLQVMKVASSCGGYKRERSSGCCCVVWSTMISLECLHWAMCIHAGHSFVLWPDPFHGLLP